MVLITSDIPSTKTVITDTFRVELNASQKQRKPFAELSRIQDASVGYSHSQ